ncbi:hypothetical protein Peur_039770 [Populus x canadensis]
MLSKAPSPSRNVPPNSNSPLDGSSVEHKNPSLDGSLEANCAKVKALSSVEHLINPLDGSLDGDCSEDGEFEEEQLDFSCSEEEYATSPPPPSSPAPAISEPPSSPTPVVLEPPVPISYTSTPSRSVKPGNPSVPPPVNADLRSSINISLPNGNSLIQKVIYETLPKFCKHCKVLGHSTGTCSKGKEEVKKFVKAGPGATKSNDKDKGNDSTHNLAAATWTIGVTNVDKAASSSAAPKGKDKDSRNDSTHLHLAAAMCSNEELLAAATCSNEELLAVAACSNETAVPACAATKANVKVKEMVSTCLNPVDEALVDIPSVAAPTVQVPSVAPSPVDISKPVVPTHPPTSCATHLSPVDASEPMAPTHPPASSADNDGQPSQVTAVGSEEWHIVGKRRHKSGNNRQSSPPLHAEGNQPVTNNATGNQQARQQVFKEKAPVCSVDIAGTKTLQRPRLGVLTRSSFHKTSNTVAGIGGVPPTIPQP